MVLQPETKDRVRTLLTQAIPMMCRNGLEYDRNFQIEGLIGITLGKEVFLVNFKETINPDREVESEEAAEEDTNSRSIDESSAGPTSPSRTKRKRKRSKDSAGKKSRQDAGDQSVSDSDNDTAPSPASNRLESHPVLSLEETSMDTALELNQTIADTARKPAKVKQEKLESDSDSDDLVVVKEEHASSYNYGNNADTVGGTGGSVFPGLSNTLTQAAVSSSFGLPQFQSTSIGSQDLQAGPSLDMSGAQLLPQQQQDPQQVDTIAAAAGGGGSERGGQAPVSHLLTTDMKLKAAGLQASYSIPISEYFTQYTDPVTGGAVFQCRICHKPASRANRRRHLNDTHSAAAFSCPQCGAVYRSRTTLRQHMKNFHSGIGGGGICGGGGGGMSGATQSSVDPQSQAMDISIASPRNSSSNNSTTTAMTSRNPQSSSLLNQSQSPPSSSNYHSVSGGGGGESLAQIQSSLAALTQSPAAGLARKVHDSNSTINTKVPSQIDTQNSQTMDLSLISEQSSPQADTSQLLSHSPWNFAVSDQNIPEPAEGKMITKMKTEPWIE